MDLFSILMQNGPVETTNYFIAGYAIFFIVMGFYLVSFYVRNRNLKQEYDLLRDLESET